MAEVDERKGDEALEVARSAETERRADASGDVDEGGRAMESLGPDKYVFAAFFVGGVGAAFLIGKVLDSIWSLLAAQPWAVRKVPVLLQYSEDERATYTMAFGGVVALLLVISLLRKEGVRRWADDVALELSKVTWPKRETVTNGTIVVIAAGLFATVYVGLLDRLWSFVTTLVYGA